MNQGKQATDKKILGEYYERKKLKKSVRRTRKDNDLYYHMVEGLS